eukprot:1681034-Ditylum_brightwellii.AAC.1
MDSNPIEVAEYAIANGIDDESVFNWGIISKAKSKYWRATHKFGIKIPKTVDEALRIDQGNQNTYWEDAIKEETKKNKVAWKM